MSRNPARSHTLELAPVAEEMAAQQAQSRGQDVEEYLSALVTETLTQRAAEERLDVGPDSLAFWEQEMERRREE